MAISSLEAQEVEYVALYKYNKNTKDTFFSSTFKV